VTERPAPAKLELLVRREDGESFELPPEVADEVCARPGFSKEDPARPAPKPAWRSRKDAEKQEEIVNDDSSQ